MMPHRTPSLRLQAHLAFTQGLPLIQKCQKSLQALPSPLLRFLNIAARSKYIEIEK